MNSSSSPDQPMPHPYHRGQTPTRYETHHRDLETEHILQPRWFDTARYTYIKIPPLAGSHSQFALLREVHFPEAQKFALFWTVISPPSALPPLVAIHPRIILVSFHVTRFLPFAGRGARSAERVSSPLHRDPMGRKALSRSARCRHTEYSWLIYIPT
jgi:hypothetical protein